MPGSGLGLAIVRQAAEAHGGWATAANARRRRSRRAASRSGRPWSSATTSRTSQPSRGARCSSSSASRGHSETARFALRTQPTRDGAAVDDRVAPLVQRDQLGQQLGAVAVGVAADRVDAQMRGGAAHRHSGRALRDRQQRIVGACRADARRDDGRPRRRRPRARSRRAASPHSDARMRRAPRPAVSASAGARSASAASRPPAAREPRAAAIARSPKTQGPH